MLKMWTFYKWTDRESRRIGKIDGSGKQTTWTSGPIGKVDRLYRYKKLRFHNKMTLPGI